MNKNVFVLASTTKSVLQIKSINKRNKLLPINTRWFNELLAVNNTIATVCRFKFYCINFGESIFRMFHAHLLTKQPMAVKIPALA